MNSGDLDEDSPFDLAPGRIEFRNESDHWRLLAEESRNAALIGYGALLAGNVDGRYKLVLETMDRVLFPKPLTVT